ERAAFDARYEITVSERPLQEHGGLAQYAVTLLVSGHAIDVPQLGHVGRDHEKATLGPLRELHVRLGQVQKAATVVETREAVVEGQAPHAHLQAPDLDGLPDGARPT